MPTTRHNSYTQCPIITYMHNSDGSIKSAKVTFAPTQHDRVAARILDQQFEDIHIEEISHDHPLNDVINRLKGK